MLSLSVLKFDRLKQRGLFYGFENLVQKLLLLNTLRIHFTYRVESVNETSHYTGLHLFGLALLQVVPFLVIIKLRPFFPEPGLLNDIVVTKLVTESV